MKAYSPNNLIIFVVDDDDDDRDFLCSAFGNFLNVVTIRQFKNGKDLLEALFSGPLPDMILLDLNMPLMCGFEVLQFIRQFWDTDQLPITVCSTTDSKEYIDKSYTLGANKYFTKPTTSIGYDNVAESVVNSLVLE